MSRRSDRDLKPYLAKLKRERLLITYGDEAEELFGNRRNSARAVGSIHARLSREVGRRYPGTEWVETEGGEVRGLYTHKGAVAMLREEGVEVTEANGRFFVDRELLQADRRRRGR